MKYYAITMERGHVGTGNFSQHITFYIAANDMLSACDIARHMPGVKHSRFPVKATAIDQTVFEMQKMNKYNAYAACGAKAKLKKGGRK